MTGSECRFANGPFAGQKLGEAGRRCRPSGPARRSSADGEFPLLVKFIFPEEKLSVQVHPDDDYAARTSRPPAAAARRKCGTRSQARPGAEVLVGLEARGHARSVSSAPSPMARPRIASSTFPCMPATPFLFRRAPRTPSAPAWCCAKSSSTPTSPTASTITIAATRRATAPAAHRESPRCDALRRASRREDRAGAHRARRASRKPISPPADTSPPRNGNSPSASQRDTFARAFRPADFSRRQREDSLGSRRSRPYRAGASVDDSRGARRIPAGARSAHFASAHLRSERSERIWPRASRRAASREAEWRGSFIHEDTESRSANPLPACAVLLAGGRGTRFWPRSRMRTPKQLLNIVGRRTMLRETAGAARAARPAAQYLGRDECRASRRRAARIARRAPVAHSRRARGAQHRRRHRPRRRSSGARTWRRADGRAALR